jgi:RNA polymerase sigma-70 factor, ECF subfamily
MDLMGEGSVVVSGPKSGNLPNGPEERPDFEGLFQDHHTALLRALWLVTRNRHEAEEIMQDAFLRMWEQWDHVDSLSDPVGYLYRTAMNVFGSRARRAKAAPRLGSPSGPS